MAYLEKIKKLFYNFSERNVQYDLDNIKPLLHQIKNQHTLIKNLTDIEIKYLSKDIQNRAINNIPMDSLLIEAYALVKESFRRLYSIELFDTQILGSILLHQQNIVEMQTGEGKTFAATMPAYLNALTGKGVHILTFNDYLAKRDRFWVGPIYEYLGLSVGYIQEQMQTRERKAAYQTDITYLTAKEAGFDYLRDNLVKDINDIVHRPFHYAIIDEADSILIDEARIPLVIAGKSDDKNLNLNNIINSIKLFQPNVDFETDEYKRNIFLTENGIAKAQNIFKINNLYEAKYKYILTQINLALHACFLLHRDVDYIVKNNKIEPVDEFTGRIAPKRRWPNGLQAALEAKEKLDINHEGIILNSISLQHYLNHYPKLAGMTGTAVEAADEYSEFYSLNTFVVPTNKPCIKINKPDNIFTHTDAKEKALIAKITDLYKNKQPVLVGTTTIKESERIALLLKNAKIPSKILNAKNDELEADIISKAGSLGEITISTNMAGRGTDIKLGHNSKEENEQVKRLGGLYVIGTNKHESKRIDKQLSGRAGRLGDPGVSEFYISLEDDLIVQYGINELIPQKHYPAKKDDPINNPVVEREINRAQRIIEGENFEIRKYLLKYSTLLEKQRTILQEKRKNVLFNIRNNSILKNKSKIRYDHLLPEAGEDLLLQVEKEISLYFLDIAWSDHLNFIEHIKEGIHLISIGNITFGNVTLFTVNRSPVDDFNAKIVDAFDLLLKDFETNVINTFEKATITQNGLDRKKEGLDFPSSTWTYLTNDNPFGDTGQRIAKNIRNMFKKKKLY
jgi:preprotein translocase subunit SecA